MDTCTDPPVTSRVLRSVISAPTPAAGSDCWDCSARTGRFPENELAALSCSYQNHDRCYTRYVRSRRPTLRGSSLRWGWDNKAGFESLVLVLTPRERSTFTSLASAILKAFVLHLQHGALLPCPRSIYAPYRRRALAGGIQVGLARTGGEGAHDRPHHKCHMPSATTLPVTPSSTRDGTLLLVLQVAVPEFRQAHSSSGSTPPRDAAFYCSFCLWR